MFIAIISEPAGTLLVVDADSVLRGLKTVVLGQQGLSMSPSHHACCMVLLIPPSLAGRVCARLDAGKHMICGFRHGIIGLLAKEAASRYERNCLAPGPTATGMRRCRMLAEQISK